MVETGRVKMYFEAEVTALEKDRLTLRASRGTERVGYDAIFVMIGSIPPWNTLRALGVRSVADEEAVQLRGRNDTLLSG